MVNDLINDKLKTAFEKNAPQIEVAATNEADAPIETVPEERSKIVTAEEELQAYYIIRGILSEIAPATIFKATDTQQRYLQAPFSQ